MTDDPDRRFRKFSEEERAKQLEEVARLQRLGVLEQMAPDTPEDEIPFLEAQVIRLTKENKQLRKLLEAQERETIRLAEKLRRNT